MNLTQQLFPTKRLSRHQIQTEVSNMESKWKQNKEEEIVATGCWVTGRLIENEWETPSQRWI